MLTGLHLHMKNSEVCIKTRSPPALLPIQGQVTKHTSVKWPIVEKQINVNTVHALTPDKRYVILFKLRANLDPPLVST